MILLAPIDAAINQLKSFLNKGNTRLVLTELKPISAIASTSASVIKLSLKRFQKPVAYALPHKSRISVSNLLGRSYGFPSPNAHMLPSQSSQLPNATPSGRNSSPLLLTIRRSSAFKNPFTLFLEIFSIMSISFLNAARLFFQTIDESRARTLACSRKGTRPDYSTSNNRLYQDYRLP